MDYIKREDVLKWCRPEDWDTPDERWRPESEFGRFIQGLPAAEITEDDIMDFCRRRFRSLVADEYGFTIKVGNFEIRRTR